MVPKNILALAYYKLKQNRGEKRRKRRETEGEL